MEGGAEERLFGWVDGRMKSMSGGMLAGWMEG
jgi:hypothetical protein